MKDEVLFYDEVNDEFSVSLNGDTNIFSFIKEYKEEKDICSKQLGKVLKANLKYSEEEEGLYGFSIDDVISFLGYEEFNVEVQIIKTINEVVYARNPMEAEKKVYDIKRQEVKGDYGIEVRCDF